MYAVTSIAIYYIMRMIEYSKSVIPKEIIYLKEKITIYLLFY